jgi:hypothetical protein
MASTMDSLRAAAMVQAMHGVLQLDRMLRAALIFSDDWITRALSPRARASIAAYLAGAQATGALPGRRMANVACAAIAPDPLPVALVGVALGCLLCSFLLFVVVPALSLLPALGAWSVKAAKYAALQNPVVRAKVKSELAKVRRVLDADFARGAHGMSFAKLPDHGLAEASITSQLSEWASVEKDRVQSGKLSGTAYRESSRAVSLFNLCYYL